MFLISVFLWFSGSELLMQYSSHFVLNGAWNWMKFMAEICDFCVYVRCNKRTLKKPSATKIKENVRHKNSAWKKEYIGVGWKITLFFLHSTLLTWFTVWSSAIHSLASSKHKQTSAYIHSTYRYVEFQWS